MTKTTDNLPGSMNAGPGGEVIGYMCLIDWECELGSAADGNRIFPSIKCLKAAHPCADDCGIVEVEVRVRDLVQKGSSYE